MRSEARAIALLAWPNLLSFAAQLAMAMVDGAVAARLGGPALAAVALILPVQMLLSQTANGAFGSATAGLIARAIGANDLERVRVLASHALIMALGIAALIACAGWLFLPSLIRAIGADKKVLALATPYAAILFVAGIAIWCNGALAGVARGARRMWLPTLCLGVAAALHAILGPLLTFGAGPVPALGLRGLALSLLACYLITLFPLWRSARRHGLLRALLPQAWSPAIFRALLQTGGLAIVSVVFSNLSVMLSTREVSIYGSHVLAGYGLGARLEYVLVPLAFAIGTALIPLCGQARGAGDVVLARRYALLGVSASAAFLGVIGVALALWPQLWSGLFRAPADVTLATDEYLRVAGWGYAFFGAGLTAFFASQAFGDMRRPLVGAGLRLAVIVFGGWLAARCFPGQPVAVYWVLAAGLAVYGCNNVLAILKVSRVGVPAVRNRAVALPGSGPV